MTSGDGSRTNRLRVALLQVAYGDDESLSDRVQRVSQWIREVGPADLVVLPELWAHGGFASTTWRATAELMNGPTIAQMASVAREVGVWLHAGSIIERAEDGADRGAERRGLWNTSVLISPQGTVHKTYRKIHRFGFGDGEPRVLEAGTDLAVAELVHDTGASRVGMATCYDLRFPELFRRLGDLGADVIVLPAAWPMRRVEHWRLLGRARALENQAWVLQCNTAGTHSGLDMGGHSQVVAPTGEVVAELGSDEDVLLTDIDLNLVASVRADFPVLADRRI
ncbi:MULTISPECIES: carbon-nitrogen family hydrolase [unclassified Nocardioides]|uniref:carbon-nitrogen family hydrolase n=1 Tax=unclassified Nocardioides TaxID=2615069 RepID=UPI0000574BC3|nr:MULTISPECIES: carbon-nitrogen family hydrolase [unclassified Nocardioides]ABL80134.1 Nitrilase/cyanide hydratase and apolipoprotein N-acyltransferase [Nocardioides sp. JS614]